MEALIIGTQSSDTKSKQAALEQVVVRLERSPGLTDVPNDVKFRLMTNCAALMKDANPKVAQLALDVVEACIKEAFAVFQPLANITFDQLIAKFGDIKQPTRARATDLMIALVNAMGLSTGLEKLLPHLNHRVWRVREQVLHTLRRVAEQYGGDLVVVVDLPRQLSALLADPQSSVRQLATDVLCDLHKNFGHSMMDDLAAAGIRPSQLKMIQQNVVAQHNCDPLTQPEPEPESTQCHSDANRAPRGLSTTSKQRPSSRGTLQLTRAISDPSVDQQQPSKQTPISARGSRAGGFGATAPIRSSSHVDADGGSPKEFNSSAQSTSAKKYSPDYFLSILGDGPSVPRSPGLVLYTERDLAVECGSILEGLQKPSDHWEDRMAALSRLQALACIDAVDFESFPTLLKGMQEQVSIQVTDLRSTVSKEACRTVAILANRMGNAFSPFAEVWLPTLLKVITVKISVISSAADRTARTVIYSLGSGSPRVAPVLLDCCAVKNPIVRKFGFECCCIAFARWRQECFDKHMTSVCKLLATGIGDADPGVRKGARLLYWVIHGRGGSWSVAMVALLRDMDANSQRHVRSEAESAKGDLGDLFRKPDTCYPVESYYSCGAPGFSAMGGHAADATAPPKSISRRAERPPVVASGVSSGPERPRSASLHKVAATESTTLVATTSMGLPKRVGSVSGARISAPGGETDLLIDNPVTPVMSLAAAREMRENRNGSRRLSAVALPSSERGSISSADALSGGSRRLSMGVGLVSGRAEDKEGTSALTNGPKRIVRQGFGALQRPAATEVIATTVSNTVESNSIIHPEGGPEDMKDVRSLDNEECKDEETKEDDTGTDDVASVDLTVPEEEVDTDKQHTLQELRAMTADAQWDVRLKALAEIKRRAGMAFPAYYFKDGVFLGTNAKKMRKGVDPALGRPLTTEYIEGVVDLTTAKIGDPHSRVAMVALECIYLVTYPMEVRQCEMGSRRPTECISSGSGEYMICPILDSTSAMLKLGYALPALFSRLADRRAKVRDKANEILNNIKAAYDPNILVAALSPRLCEVSDRVRTAVVQFLLTIAALCEPFFRNPSNTHQFLSRMAHILGSGGTIIPSTALLLTGKRLLELVYRTAPQVMLSQVAGLPLQEQVIVKKTLSAIVPNIDAAVGAASKVEWNRVSSDNGGARNSQSLRHSQPTRAALPVANLDTSVDCHVFENDTNCDGVEEQGEVQRRIFPQYPPSPPRPLSLEVDGEDTQDISECSLYAPLDADIDTVDVDIHLEPQHCAQKTTISVAEAKVSPLRSRNMKSPSRRGQSPLESKVNSQSPAAGSGSHTALSSVTSPHLADSRDIVWLLRTLSSTEFVLCNDERRNAISELKTLIKQGTDGFWSRNFAQIISVLLDSFTPVTAGERSVSLSAAAGLEEFRLVSDVRVPITGLSPPGNLSALHRTRGSIRDTDINTSKANSQSGSSSDWLRRENLSASEYNHDVTGAAESKGLADATGEPAAEEQILRMEYLHNVCRVLVLIVRHRSINVTNFLELMTCRLCEAAAFLPIALTMQCEQILSMACPLGPQGVAKALAPYCSYGSGSVSMVDTDGHVGRSGDRLPPPPDPSFASSPTSSVRRLALRVLALCVPHLTSRQLISILPLLMAHILPSFRSPLVDIRQAVVGAIVQMYVLVGDVLHPYVKELPPQQKKLLTIYIDRQLKSSAASGNTKIMATGVS